MPRVFIGIPTLNRPDFVRMAVQSVRDQTFQDAQRIDARIRTCYREAGFSLLDVPSLPVQERAVFVLRSLGIADI